MIGSPVSPHALGLPIVPGVSCPGGSLDPICGVAGSAASGIASAGAGAVLGAVTSWVVSGATWLLDRIGDVLSATTSIDVGSGWFSSHFSVMIAIAGVVVLPLLLISVIQAIYRQSAATLLRALFVNLPLAVLLTFAALQLVQMGLKITDDLSALVASGSGTDLHHVLATVVSSLTTAAAATGLPAFVLMLGALVLALGAFALWIELLLRAAAVYVAVLFLPLALASLVWPAISHTCRRLVEMLVALILSKFVVVSVLCLALGAVSSSVAGQGGSGFTGVLEGAALLLLAAFSPFALLRLVPIAEFGAVEHLDAVRHRAGRALTSAPRMALTAHSLAQMVGGGSIEGALASTGPVGSPLGSATEQAGAAGSTDSGSEGSGSDPSPGSPHSGGGSSGAAAAPVTATGISPWKGEPGDLPGSSGWSEGAGGGLAVAGSGSESLEGAGARYLGPAPVQEAPSTPLGGHRDQVVERDDMGPTIRFVRPGDRAGEDVGAPDRTGPGE